MMATVGKPPNKSYNEPDIMTIVGGESTWGLELSDKPRDKVLFDRGQPEVLS